MRGLGGRQVEQDADKLLSFSDRLKCAGHDIHMLFVKRSDVKKGEVAKDAGKELVFPATRYAFTGCTRHPHTISLLSADVSARPGSLGSATFFIILQWQHNSM